MAFPPSFFNYESIVSKQEEIQQKINNYKDKEVNTKLRYNDLFNSKEFFNV